MPASIKAEILNGENGDEDDEDEERSPISEEPYQSWLTDIRSGTQIKIPGASPLA